MPPLESRRITGRHLLIDAPGAAAELERAPDWEVRARALATGLGWESALATRHHAGGATIALTAPPDQLTTACDLLEAAAGDEPLAEALYRLLHAAAAEADPTLREAVRAALADGRRHFWDDEGFHLVPDDLPVVYVTGTNGKTTTTRMLARIAEKSGYVAGQTSSDGVRLGREWLEKGDWTGPGAARALLRDPRLGYAVLETARGGLMRRGLVLDGADAAIVTNVAADHLGEWGLYEVEDMAEAKLVVGRGVRQGGAVVIGDCAALEGAVARLQADRPDLRVLRYGVEGPSDAFSGFVADDALWLREDGDAVRLLGIEEVPLGLGGAARHNLANALAAALAARATGISLHAVREGLRSLQPDAEDSLGRANLYRLPSGAAALLDFAHNPDGMRTVAAFAARWPPGGRALLLGCAGDRTDAIIRELAATAATIGLTRVYLKELPEHHRGRAWGEVPGLLRETLLAHGVAPEALVDVPDEALAARRAVEESQAGDLVVLLVHERLEDVTAMLAEIGAESWGAGSDRGW